MNDDFGDGNGTTEGDGGGDDAKFDIGFPDFPGDGGGGASWIVVVSNEGWFHDQSSPTVQVIRDVSDRWIQARRIWNQHTYHVSNVHEDGTIPQVEPHHWELLNTFRTNAQLENGGTCRPPPP